MQCAHSTLPYFSRQRTSTCPSGISWIRTDGCDLLDANAGCLSVQVVFLPNKYSVVLRCIEYITLISTRMNQQRSVGDTLRAVSFSCCSRQHWTGQLGFKKVYIRFTLSLHDFACAVLWLQVMASSHGWSCLEYGQTQPVLCWFCRGVSRLCHSS